MKEAYFNSQDKSTNVRVGRIRRSVTHAVLGLLWRRAPVLTRWWALRQFFTPGAYRAHPVEAACLKQGRPFQIEVNDKTIKGWKWGTGPAVLLVHGWNGRGVQFHGFVAPLVQAGYTAMAIDGPAHGESTGRVTSYFEFTDTVRSLLSEKRNLGIKGVIAHSFGAAAVINALAKEGLSLNMVWIAPVLRLRELLFNTLEQFGIPKDLYTSLIREFETRHGYNLEKDNPWRLIAGLSGTALIVHDEKDRTAHFEDSREQARKHGNISLYATRGLGHRRILTDPEVIRRCAAHMGSAQTLREQHHCRRKRMNQMEEIIEAYAGADEELRLSLFLSHRDYRRQFTQIDMAEMTSQGKALSGPVNGWARDPVTRGLTRSCWRWLKHCWSAR